MMRAWKNIPKRGMCRQEHRLESAADRVVWEGGYTFNKERVGGHSRQGARLEQTQGGRRPEPCQKRKRLG